MNSTMKICFILNISIYEHGPSVHILKDIIGSLKEHKVTVIHKQTTNEDENIDNVNIISIPFKKAKKNQLIKRYFVDVLYALKVIRIIKRKKVKYDVFFLQSSNTAFLLGKWIKKHTNSRLIYNVQDIFPDNLITIRNKSTFYLNLMDRFNIRLYKKVDSLITISPDMKETLVTKGINENKIHVIYNWSFENNLSHNTSFDFRKEYSLEEKFIVLYAGNLGLFQNAESILDVAKNIANDNIIFVIVGDGVKKKYIEDRITKEKLLNVILLPYQKLENMNQIYSSADVNYISLRNGIVKTALPSKLAFCLNADKPIIFTVNNSSRISKLLSRDDSIKCIDPSDSTEIIDSINLFKTNKFDFTNRKHMKKLFEKNENINTYIKLILFNNKEL